MLYQPSSQYISQITFILASLSYLYFSHFDCCFFHHVTEGENMYIKSISVWNVLMIELKLIDVMYISLALIVSTIWAFTFANSYYLAAGSCVRATKVTRIYNFSSLLIERRCEQLIPKLCNARWKVKSCVFCSEYFSHLIMKICLWEQF